MRLKDKVVLITASTRGIGYAIVEACAKEGAIVYMAVRNMETGEAKANELNNKGFNVKTVYNDAYKKDTYISMIDEVVKNEGRINVLVNNFGTSDPKVDQDIKTTDYDVFLNTIDANILSEDGRLLLFLFYCLTKGNKLYGKKWWRINNKYFICWRTYSRYFTSFLWY